MSGEPMIEVTVRLPEQLVARLRSLEIETGHPPEMVIRDALSRELAGWPWPYPPKLEAYGL